MNKKLVSILIVILFTILFASRTEAAILRLNLYYQNGEIIWDNNSSEKIQYFKDLYFVEPTAAGENNYEVVIRSFKGVILKTFKKDLQPALFFRINSEINRLGGTRKLMEGATTIELPYYPNASEVDVLDNSGNKIFSADLSAFATCNENNICEPNLKENIETCPSDCTKITKTSWPFWIFTINWD